MPRPSKRSLLAALPRETLLGIARAHELDVRANASHASLVDAIARSKRASREKVVRGLSRVDLKKICRAHELDDSGRAKKVIAARGGEMSLREVALPDLLAAAEALRADRIDPPYTETVMDRGK